MTEIKMENGKSNVCRDDKNPSFGDVSSSSFSGLTRESSNAHNERGRSMVEMLGVLAVAGVLSIGGVAGYRYAIDKMNANDIINEVKKRAVCDNTEYKWVATRYQGGNYSGCSPCSGDWKSDTEDRIEALCTQCNQGVDWTGGSASANMYWCSTTSEDIGTKPICTGNDRNGFIASQGNCVPCSSTSNYITATADECAKCDDTETPRYMNGNYCQLSSENYMYYTNKKEACFQASF